MEDTVREMENVGVQLETVSDLLSVILDNLLYFGKLNPASGNAADRLEIATLCSNLPKGQSLLYLAQEKVRDIQGRVDTLVRHSLQNPQEEVKAAS